MSRTTKDFYDTPPTRPSKRRRLSNRERLRLRPMHLKSSPDDETKIDHDDQNLPACSSTVMSPANVPGSPMDISSPAACRSSSQTFRAVVGGNTSDLSHSFQTPPSGSSDEATRSNFFTFEKHNPFEEHLLSNLHKNLWSPSVFANISASSETPPSSGLSIDQKSRLFPVSLENSPSSHQRPYPVDEQKEARAQEAILNYFQNDIVAPSPTEMKSAKLERKECTVTSHETDSSAWVPFQEFVAHGGNQMDFSEYDYLKSEDEAALQCTGVDEEHISAISRRRLAFVFKDDESDLNSSGHSLPFRTSPARSFDENQTPASSIESPVKRESSVLFASEHPRIPPQSPNFSPISKPSPPF